MNNSILFRVGFNIIFFYIFIFVPIFGVLIQPSLIISLFFLLLFLNGKFKNIFSAPALIIFFIFFCWSLFSSLFANNILAAYETEGKLFVVLLFIFIIASFLYETKKNIFIFYDLYIYILVLLFFFSFFTGTFNILLESDNTARVKEVEELSYDPNTFGYFIFFGLSFYFTKFSSINSSFFKLIIFFVLLFLSFILILYNATRGGYLVYLFLICMFSIALLFKKKLLSGKYLFLYFLIVFILFSFSFSGFTFLIQDSELEKRFEQAAQDDTSPRILHFYEAIRVGLENPILGVGGGNYAWVPRFFEQGNFSHNSFTEAFANYGFPGLFLLVLLYLEYAKQLIYLFLNPIIKNKLTIVSFFIFFLAFLFYNIFYVTYLSIEFMGAYFISYFHMLWIKKTHI